MFVFVFLLAFALIASPGLAQIVDGNRAYKECEADDKTSINYFISGVIDTATNDKAALLSKTLQYSVNTSPVPSDLTKGILKEMRSFCLNQSVDPVRVRDVVCGYLKSNPALRNMSAAKLTMDALQSAYPCAAR
ncbi:MAG TPA: Rap1a/Tai family immunity protein [Afipia sp.]